MIVMFLVIGRMLFLRMLLCIRCLVVRVWYCMLCFLILEMYFFCIVLFGRMRWNVVGLY